MKLQLLPAVGALVAAVCCADTARATVMIETTLAKLASESDTVLRGTIVGAEVAADAEQVTWTRYTVAVHEVFAGEVDRSTFSFRCMGGSANGFTSGFAGAPKFRPGEQVVLFVDADNPYCQITGFERGVLRVTRTKTGGAALVNWRGDSIAALGRDDAIAGIKLVDVEPDLVTWLQPVPGTNGFTGVPRKSGSAAPAPLAPLLQELHRFCKRHAVRARLVTSITRITGQARSGQVAAAPKP